MLKRDPDWDDGGAPFWARFIAWLFCLKVAKVDGKLVWYYD